MTTPDTAAIPQQPQPKITRSRLGMGRITALLGLIDAVFGPQAPRSTALTSSAEWARRGRTHPGGFTRAWQARHPGWRYFDPTAAQTASEAPRYDRHGKLREVA